MKLLTIMLLMETSANSVDGRFECKFESSNVVNLPDRKLSKFS